MPMHIHPNRRNLVLIFSAAAVAQVASFAFSIAAEFQKSSKEDLRLDGKICSLAQSSSLGLGVAALICLSAAQVLGNWFACKGGLCGGGNNYSRKVRKPTVTCILLAASWISFAVAFILLSVATSMSRNQPLGEGWLDGDCYLVKDGVYAGSAVLGFMALVSALGSTAIAIRRRQGEEDSGIPE